MKEEATPNEVAKTAASQPGMVLRLSMDEYDDLVDASFKAELEANIFASNIESIVKRLNVFGSIVEQIKEVVAFKSGFQDAPQVKLDRISSILSAEGNAYQLEEAQSEATNKPGVAEATQGATRAVSRAGLSVLGFAAAIPLLIANPQIVDIVKGFFTGFLKGVGVSNEALSYLKPAIGITLGVLATAFTMKALAPVIVAFQKLRQLAVVLGLAAEETKDSSDAVKKKDKEVKNKDKEVRKEQGRIDKEKDDIKKGTDTAKDEVKKGKDEIKKAKKAGKGSNTKIGKFIDKAKFLLEKTAPKLKSMAGNILKAIPVVGTVLGIGLVLYELYSIGSDIYDVFFGKEEEETPAAEQKPVPAATAPAAAVSPAQAARAREDHEEQYRNISKIGETAPVIQAPAAPPAPPPALEPPPPPIVIDKTIEIEQAARDISMKAETIVLNINNLDVINTIEKKTQQVMDSFFSVTVGV